MDKQIIDGYRDFDKPKYRQGENKELDITRCGRLGRY
jgi:hypothetical protein